MVEGDPMPMLKSIHIQGFKSIRDARADLDRVNVLIGANASGKSNLIAFFRMLNAIGHHRLQDFVPRVGGAETLLRNGLKGDRRIVGKVSWGGVPPHPHSYIFNLDLTPNGRLFFASETIFGSDEQHEKWPAKNLIGNQFETSLPSESEFVATCRVSETYAFHDTSPFSDLRKSVYVSDAGKLNGSGSNLPAILHKYAKTKPAFYRRIVATVRQVFPQFDDFVLEPDALAPTQIKLNWRERGQDTLFGPHQFSDGTLRFIALATLLQQPEEELPKVIVIDEPELGLHPNGITVLAALIHKASHHSQLIVATQSVTLLDQFDPEEIIVVERDRVHKATEFRRLDAPSLAGWLEEYTLGDLWRKNVIGGGPN